MRECINKGYGVKRAFPVLLYSNNNTMGEHINKGYGVKRAFPALLYSNNNPTTSATYLL